jgi:hypothetical protein
MEAMTTNILSTVLSVLQGRAVPRPQSTQVTPHRKSLRSRVQAYLKGADDPEIAEIIRDYRNLKLKRRVVHGIDINTKSLSIIMQTYILHKYFIDRIQSQDFVDTIDELIDSYRHNPLACTFRSIVKQLAEMTLGDHACDEYLPPAIKIVVDWINKSQKLASYRKDRYYRSDFVLTTPRDMSSGSRVGVKSRMVKYYLTYTPVKTNIPEKS